MYYYDIALPLKPDRLFTYFSTHTINKGCRVLVSFHNQLYTGIVWGKNDNPDESLKYKSVLEIIDKKSLIHSDLLELAAWINRYYHTSLGITLSAMLPAAFNVQVQLQVKVDHSQDRSILQKPARDFLTNIRTADWIDVSSLKKKIPLPASIEFWKSWKTDPSFRLKEYSTRK